MSERCTIWCEPDAPAYINFEVYMGINRDRVCWNISRILKLCDVIDWKMY
jgi:hypothetical protein